jgi:hypothetical protein
MFENLSAQIAALSPAVKGALLLLAVLQCILQIFCVIDLVRRPAVTGGNKWLWGVLIVAGGLLGCLFYLGLGRNLNVVLEGDEAAGNDHATKRAIDDLYGDKR